MSTHSDNSGINPGEWTLPDDQVVRADWVTLSVFEVSCQNREKVNAPVYSNRRQQVPITVRIEARDVNGVAVRLTEQQLSEIRLIDYDDPDREFFGGVTPDPRYVYNHNVSLVGNHAMDTSEERPDANSIQSITRHLRWQPIYYTVKLAAEIKSPRGVVYRTNVANAVPGEFDSWVNVVGIEPVRFGVSDMEVARHNQMDAPDVDLYYVKFKDNRYYIASQAYFYDPYESGSHAASGRDSGQVKFCVLNNNGKWYYQFFYADLSVKQVEYNWHGIKVSFPVNQKQGQSTFARLSLPLLPLDWGDQKFSHAQEVIYYNQHGNSARVQMRPVEGGNEMRLEDA